MIDSRILPKILQKNQKGNNGLVGTIPYEIGYLSSLKRLGLEHNSLTGSVPFRTMALTMKETSLPRPRLVRGWKAPHDDRMMKQKQSQEMKKIQGPFSWP